MEKIAKKMSDFMVLGLYSMVSRTHGSSAIQGQSSNIQKDSSSCFREGMKRIFSFPDVKGGSIVPKCKGQAEHLLYRVKSSMCYFRKHFKKLLV